MEIEYGEIRSFKRLDLLKILELYGHTVKKKSNGSFLTLCPFHEDKEPSLSITQKNDIWLWHCFGCHMGGTVIDFVMKKENLNFKEAYERLREMNGSIPAVTHQSYEVSPKEISHRKVLKEVVEYYHQSLKEKKEAQRYLESRGLLDPGIIKDYKLGFSDGTLPKDPDLLEALEDLGILNPKGNEHFIGCIVFPIEDKEGKIVSLYGRSLKNGRHLYLKGPHNGVFNARIVKYSKRIFITESIIDALSLIKLGIRETIALYGTGGFTNDHRDLLSNSGLEEVYLVMDNDPAGERAARSLIDKIPLTITRLFKVNLPQGIKDPNDYLLSGKDPAYLLEGSEELRKGPSLLNNDWNIEEETSEIRFKRPDRSYRIRGLAAERLDILKVSVRIHTEEGYHLDSIDLYSQKARQGFSKHCQKLLRLKDHEIERDLKFIIDKLEEIQVRMLDGRYKSGSKVHEMTKTERNEALEYLKDPNIIERILLDAKITGHVGEERNFLLGYLVSISRKLKHPLGLLVISQSSAGKTALQDRVLSFTPPEDVIKLTRLTDQSLFYQERCALKHKLIAIEEEEGAQGAGYSIRHLLSSRGLSSLATIKDETSGKLRSVSHEVEGPTAVMITTTHSEVNHETYNRFIIITIDESLHQTKAILSMQRKKETLEGVIDQRKNEAVTRIHHNLQRLLKPLEIVNPFAEKLIFTDSVLRARREQMKYMSLIKTVALLRQHQKEIKEGYDGKTPFEYIEVDKKDIQRANEIAMRIFTQSLDDMTPQTRKFLDLIDKMVLRIQGETKKDRLDIVVSRREMREYTGWSDYQARKHIQELTELEYLIPVAGSKGKRFNYCLAWDPESHKKGEILLQSVDNL